MIASMSASVTSCRAAEARRAQRGTHGELPAPAFAARHQQVGHVRARQQQHERDGAGKHRDHGTAVPEQALAQWLDRDAEVSLVVLIRILPCEPTDDRVHLSGRGRDRAPGSSRATPVR